MGSKSPANSQSVKIEDARDQYADHKASDVWGTYIIDREQRENNYKKLLIGMLRDNGCRRVLDAACGDGVDSMMLLDEGFEVVSVDAADGMVEITRRAKARNRGKPGYDKWIIEEANWLTLENDIKDLIGDGFDAVICLGNSFAHILNTHGDYREQKLGLKNFYNCVKPGGILLIDHRNFDYIVHGGETPPINSMYYNNKYLKKIESSVSYENGKPNKVTFDYFLILDKGRTGDFRLSYYPYTLDEFTKLVDEAFREPAKHDIRGDFRSLEEVPNPGFYVHLLQKKRA